MHSIGRHHRPPARRRGRHARDRGGGGGDMLRRSCSVGRRRRPVEVDAERPHEEQEGEGREQEDARSVPRALCEHLGLDHSSAGGAHGARFSRRRKRARHSTRRPRSFTASTASEHGGPRRVSPLEARFAGRPGVWGVPHPARDQWRVPRVAALRKDPRSCIPLFARPPFRVAGWALATKSYGHLVISSVLWCDVASVHYSFPFLKALSPQPGVSTTSSGFMFVPQTLRASGLFKWGLRLDSAVPGFRC